MGTIQYPLVNFMQMDYNEDLVPCRICIRTARGLDVVDVKVLTKWDSERWNWHTVRNLL